MSWRRVKICVCLFGNVNNGWIIIIIFVWLNWVWIGRDGLTHNMLELIHSHWRGQQVCKVRCKGVPTVDMDNICRHLEVYVSPFFLVFLNFICCCLSSMWLEKCFAKGDISWPKFLFELSFSLREIECKDNLIAIFGNISITLLRDGMG